MPHLSTEAPVATGALASESVTPSTAGPLSRDPLTPGRPGYRRMSFGLFAAGVAAFALLYSTQALLPAISADLGVSAGRASWTVSAATGALALFVLPLSALSERFGRRTLMTVSLTVAVAVGLLVPFAPSLEWLIALRAVQGAALAGLPASAMAYLAEEVRPRALVGAIGLFVAGNSIGGMSGRIVAGWISQAWGWRAALAVVGLIALVCVVVFRVLLPRARNFTPATLNPLELTRTVGRHLADPLLRRLYAIGALFMTVFGAVYTAIGFRLVAEPFNLPQGVIGSIFLVYLVGTVSSAAAGKLVGGSAARRPVSGGRHDRGGSAVVARRLARRRTARPGPDHGGLLRGPRGRLVGREPDGEDRPRAGVGALPERVLRGQQRGRHAGRRGVPRGRLGGDGGARAGRGARCGLGDAVRDARGPSGAAGPRGGAGAPVT